MFRHIVYSLANRQGLFAYVRTCKTWLDTTTKFMVVVTSLSLFNLVISSFRDNMFYHAWTWLLIYHDGSNNVVQVRSFIKPWTVCSNMHEQACQQPCSSWPAQPCHQVCQQPCSSWPAQPCHQVCQQPYSSWSAQPCSSLSTTMLKLVSSTLSTTMSKPVNHVQAGQINHVQAGQLNHVQAGQLNHVQPVNRQKQAVCFYVCICGRSKLKGGGCKLYVSSL